MGSCMNLKWESMFYIELNQCRIKILKTTVLINWFNRFKFFWFCINSEVPFSTKTRKRLIYIWGSNLILLIQSIPGKDLRHIRGFLILYQKHPTWPRLYNSSLHNLIIHYTYLYCCHTTKVKCISNIFNICNVLECSLQMLLSESPVWLSVIPP